MTSSTNGEYPIRGSPTGRVQLLRATPAGARWHRADGDPPGPTRPVSNRRPPARQGGTLSHPGPYQPHPRPSPTSRAGAAHHHATGRADPSGATIAIRPLASTATSGTGIRAAWYESVRRIARARTPVRSGSAGTNTMPAPVATTASAIPAGPARRESHTRTWGPFGADLGRLVAEQVAAPGARVKAGDPQIGPCTGIFAGLWIEQPRRPHVAQSLVREHVEQEYVCREGAGHLRRRRPNGRVALVAVVLGDDEYEPSGLDQPGNVCRRPVVRNVNGHLVASRYRLACRGPQVRSRARSCREVSAGHPFAQVTEPGSLPAPTNPESPHRIRRSVRRAVRLDSVVAPRSEWRPHSYGRDHARAG